MLRTASGHGVSASASREIRHARPPLPWAHAITASGRGRRPAPQDGRGDDDASWSRSATETLRHAAA